MTEPEQRPGQTTKADDRRSVCVYCGSRMGDDARGAALAEALGSALARSGLRLVYGAGDLGLMGVVAGAARQAGGPVLGVIPEGLFVREARHRDDPDVIVTENLHQRKALMLANADGVIVLPGGVGTLDEFIEAATWRHLGLHRKPIVLLDPDGFWTPLLEMFARMAAAGFLWEDFAPRDGDGAAFAVERSVDAALGRLQRDWAAQKSH